MANGWGDLVRDGLRAIVKAATPPGRAPQSGTTTSRTRTTKTPDPPTTAPVSGRHTALPDFEGRLTPTYAPDLDGDADPGEIVWTWVPYEDDPTQGKDRPVLLVGHDEPYLLGLMLTSKDHDRNNEREARRGRYWMDIGSGDWDAKRRPSEIRLDRVLRVDPGDVRREGAIVARRLFDQITRSLAEVKGW
jgi:hypothetical protein